MILKKFVLSIVLFSFAFPTFLFATEDTHLFFDENAPRDVNFSFDIEESKRLRPQPNDFEILHFSPMSNKIGERWILITVKNSAIGHRILKSEHIVATFANGDQANPINLSKSVEAGSILTKHIYFGVKKFPIVMLEIQP